MEFDEVREYFPGDDVRSIDWNVTARTGQPHIKKFTEERQLTIMFLLDASMSCNFGTINRLKSELAAEICAVLAFSAVKNNDRVGLIVFSDKIEKFIPPKKGTRHVLRVIREALYHKPESTGTDIPAAIEYLNAVTKRKSVTFLISDFLAEDFKKPLSIANRKHDLIAVNIKDPREMHMLNAGIVLLKDAETGTFTQVDTRSKEFRREYAAQAQARQAGLKKLLNSINVDVINADTERPYSRELIRFFKMRERRI